MDKVEAVMKMDMLFKAKTGQMDMELLELLEDQSLLMA